MTGPPEPSEHKETFIRKLTAEEIEAMNPAIPRIAQIELSE